MPSHRVLFLFCIFFTSVWAQPSQDWQDLPESLRVKYQQWVQRSQSSNYLPEKNYKKLMRRLEKPISREKAIKLLQDLTQFAFDHDQGNNWILGLANDLKMPAMSLLQKEAYPEKIEIVRVQFKNDLVVFGTGGTLHRLYPVKDETLIAGQKYLEPNIGLTGVGNWWIAKEDIIEFKRVYVPLPKAFLKSKIQEVIDSNGNLLIDGLWIRPGISEKRETISLKSQTITTASTLFVNSELGIQAARLTYQYRALAKGKKLSEQFQKDVGWKAPPPRDLSSQEKVYQSWQEKIAPLRKKAPKIIWPAPFNPEIKIAQEALKREDLIDNDPEASLLRIRFALTYGNELPKLALKSPKNFLKLEEAVRKSFKIEKTKPVLKLKPKWKDLAAVIRHVPDFEASPAPGKIENAFVRFPKNYSPWRKFPMLIVLHGQSCRPDGDFRFWSQLVDQEEMILVCPRYGSTDGFDQSEEDDQKVLNIVRKLLLQYNVDPNRLYVTGLSMGGGKTWSLAACYTGKWAAVAPQIRGPVWRMRTPIEGSRRTRIRYMFQEHFRQLPIYLHEGQFDGLNTFSSRHIVEVLKGLKAPIEYYEAPLFGHAQMPWRYPSLLRWFSEKKRNAHPTKITAYAIHSWSANFGWVSIKQLKSPSVYWSRKEGKYHEADLTGIEASYKEGIITLKRLEGSPREIEVFYDPKLMTAKKLKIKTGSKTKSWSPQISIKKMLQRVIDTGEREQVFPSSRKVIWPKK